MSFSQETFSAEFNDPNATIFSQQGGQFATDYAWWGGLRTLSGNGELETYVDPFFGSSPYNPFSIANGVLTISAIPTPPGLKNDVSTPYVSGMLETSPSFAQQYGYFEMRAQLPAGQGLWPAFWLVGENQSDYTEIDILEALGNNTKTLYFSTHMNASRGTGTQITANLSFDYSTGMHAYGLAWTPDWLILYVDGQEMARMDGTPLRGAAPMFMIANEAVGGSWPGSPNASTQFPAQMKIDYIRAYAYSAPSVPQPVTVGSGNDSLVVTVNEDAFQGDAQFTVSVDGVQVGGTQTTTALHASGQTQAFTFKGNWGTGQHAVVVNFLYDAYGGSAALDRNLYVTAMSYDGTNYPADTAALMAAGPVSFTVGSATATTPQPVTVGSGNDSLVVTVNEDAYQGDAQFTVSVDGVQVGGTQTTTALRASGQTQAFTFKGNWGTGQHAVVVNFLYDAYGGSAALDRNLYVTAMSYDGTNYPADTAALMTAGPVSFTVGSGSGTLTVTTGQTVTVPNGTYTVNMTGTSETVTAGTSGADTFVFNNTSPAVATINGFKLGTDKVTTTTGLHDFANTSGGVDMRFNDGTHVTLAGVTNATAVAVMSSTINTVTVSGGQNVTTQPGFTDTVNIAGSGNATVNVNGNDTINCNTGTDTIRVSAGNVTVNGNTGAISFVGGGSGSATFNLKGGTTTATFGSGGATVNVAGKDTFTCGSGVETFNFTNDASIDTAVINQFRVGTDHLHLNGYGSGTTTGASITNATGGVSIRLTDGSSIRLNGIATNTTLSQLFN